MARKIAAVIVGGDATNASIVHPIRWPGSWHRKGEPRLCRIAAIDDTAEVDLDTALDVLQRAYRGKGNGSAPDWFEQQGDQQTATEKKNWGELIDKVQSGEAYHEPLNQLAMKLVLTGMDQRAVVNLLQGLMETSGDEHDARWKVRYEDIGRSVSTAAAKIMEQRASARATAKATELVDDINKSPAISAADDDSGPVDLWEAAITPPLPTGLLPPVIENFARVQGKLMGADPAGLAMGALTVCAAVISDEFKLQVKKNDGWTESARLWVGLVGNVSSKKSPVLHAVTSRILQLDADLVRQYLAEKIKYDDAEKSERGEKPPEEHLVMMDVTTEAAMECMHDNSNGILVYRDELAGWFGSMEKYGGGHKGASADRGFWLESFNGHPYKWKRIGRGLGIIERASACILGGIQPDVITKVVGEGYDDGLLQRFFMIMLRDGEVGEDAPTSQEAQDYDDLVEQLYQKTQHHISPVPLQFSAKAQVIRAKLERDSHELASGLQKINKKLAAHVFKYHGMFARLCLLWHQIEHHADKFPSNVDAETAQRVADFMHDFLLPHAISFYKVTTGLSDDHDRLCAVGGFILARKLNSVTNRDIQRGDRTMRKLTQRDTLAVFEQLEAFGWVTRPFKIEPGPVTKWIVNEAVHQRFAQRAKEEAERRQHEWKQIKASLSR